MVHEPLGILVGETSAETYFKIHPRSDAILAQRDIYFNQGGSGLMHPNDLFAGWYAKNWQFEYMIEEEAIENVDTFSYDSLRAGPPRRMDTTRTLETRIRGPWIDHKDYEKNTGRVVFSAGDLGYRKPKLLYIEFYNARPPDEIEEIRIRGYFVQNGIEYDHFDNSTGSGAFQIHFGDHVIFKTSTQADHDTNFYDNNLYRSRVLCVKYIQSLLICHRIR